MRIISAAILLLLPAALWAADSDTPVASWSFDEAPTGVVTGKIQVANSDLVAPLFPNHPDVNSALSVSAPAYLAVNDSTDGDFDFKNGDSLTVETWVNLKSLSQHAYIISKGRTERSGQKSRDQNWAVRLRKSGGEACLNFLFHSQGENTNSGDWHRWTSKSGFTVGDGWHHLAVSYTFGRPDSIRGILDGKTVTGKWDMGGPTKRPPVSTDSPVWIGSAMAGSKDNSLNGMIDNLAVYRTIVDEKELRSRYQILPTPIVRPKSTGDAVVNELYGPIGNISYIPKRVGPPRLTWTSNELAFTRLPHHYDSWGVRDDWAGDKSKAMFVRSWKDITLEPGDYQFMLRSRSFSRLFIDGREVVATPKQRNRSGAHHVVDPLPDVPVAGMRPAFMNDHQRVADFHSEGGKHELRYEVIVGGPSFRLEFGETAVAIAKKTDSHSDTDATSSSQMFRIVSARNDYPLTDDGWQRFSVDQQRSLDELDATNRRRQSALQDDFWRQRHDYAKQNLSSGSQTLDIDTIIGNRIDAENKRRLAVKASRSSGVFFQNHVRPILQTHCVRCHGDKTQGELAIFDRDNLLRGGESGDPAVVPGKPGESYLLELVSADADDYRMPPKGDGLSAEEIATIKKWIAAGAEIPAAAKSTIELSKPADEYTFLRRVYLDTVGVAPSIIEAREYLDDNRFDRRAKLIDRLLDHPQYARKWADNWVGYWQDALAENPNLLKPTLNNTGPFRYWIHEALTDNKPIDRFATELIQMRGSKWYGGAGGFSIASQNDVPMAAKAHVVGTAFMGVEMKCARCHDAPYHSWKQGDLFRLAAMLDRKPIKLPESSSVPAAFFEQQERESLIKVTLKPGETVHGEWPFAEFAPEIESQLLQAPDDSRERLAAQVTASRRFAEVIANRIWKRLIGVGIVQSTDDWEGNPPSDPILLARLADALIESDYDVKSLARLIMNSDVYSRTAIDVDDDSQYFAGPARRRMTAEQIVDTAFHATGVAMATEQLTLDVEGTLPADRFLNFGFPKRSWEFSTLANERDRPSLALPRVQAVADALQAFGWRSSRPEPTSHREETPNLVQPGILANGTLGVWLTRLSDDSGLTQLALKTQPIDSFVDDLFLTMLTRKPTKEEKNRFVETLRDGYNERIKNVPESLENQRPKRFRYVSWSNHLNTEANVIKVEMQELCRKGPEPTYRLSTQWRERAEDAVWALLNSPESVLVP